MRQLPRRIAPRRQQLLAITRSARHPLWWLPDPAAQQDEAFRRVWQNLRTVTEVRDGRYFTDAWRSHPGPFVMCLVRVPVSGFGPQFDVVREALQPFPFVQYVPNDFLHIPVQEIGFVNEHPTSRHELPRARVDEFIAMAERPLLDFPRFPLVLGPVNSFADSAFLDVTDGGWLSRIHRRLLDFVPLTPSQRFPYLPHMTLAHYIESAPIGNLPAVLAEWRDLELGSFIVDEVDVVSLDTQVEFPPFEVLHRFELGTTRATGGLPLRPHAFD